MVQNLLTIFRRPLFGVPSAWQKPLKIVSGFLDGRFTPQCGSSVVVFNTENVVLECFSLID